MPVLGRFFPSPSSPSLDAEARQAAGGALHYQECHGRRAPHLHDDERHGERHGSCRRRGRCLPIVPPYTMMPGRLSRAKPTSLAAAMLSLVPRSSRCMLHGLPSHHTEPAAADLRLSQRVCAK